MMAILTAPVERLADDAVTLRLPSPDAGDVATVDNYIQQEQLDGGWLPDVPLVSGQQLVAGWLDGWAGRPSRNGPAFVVTVPEHSRFIGVVGMNERDEGTVEISYGTAPHWRSRGLASHAARLGAQWIARQPGVHRVGARIGQADRASERVAVKAAGQGRVTVAAARPESSGRGAGRHGLTDGMPGMEHHPGAGGARLRRRSCPRQPR